MLIPGQIPKRIPVSTVDVMGVRIYDHGYASVFQIDIMIRFFVVSVNLVSFGFGCMAMWFSNSACTKNIASRVVECLQHKLVKI